MEIYKEIGSYLNFRHLSRIKSTITRPTILISGLSRFTYIFLDCSPLDILETLFGIGEELFILFKKIFPKRYI